MIQRTFTQNVTVTPSLDIEVITNYAIYNLLNLFFDCILGLKFTTSIVVSLFIDMEMGLKPTNKIKEMKIMQKIGKSPDHKEGFIVSMNIGQLSEPRQTILLVLKRDGPATIAELASRLAMTGEAVRQHLLQLEREGWIKRSTKRESGFGGGRPSMQYSLTPEGEHLFPKHYDALTVEVIDTIADQLGSDALLQILSTMTEVRVREWEPRLRGLSLEERLEALKEIYLADDAFMDVENSGDQLCLIERNCPFLNVAKQRPVLCSVTVSMLTRLLGYRVVREERFQNGDGRCVFRVLLDQPVDVNSFRFALEFKDDQHNLVKTQRLTNNLDSELI